MSCEPPPLVPLITTTPDERAALDAMRRVTPARLFVGRAGASYRTATLLGLRADHAAARDAVRSTLDLDDPPLRAVLTGTKAVRAATLARSIDEHLIRPDLGRVLDAESTASIAASGTRHADVQLVIGDGLSALAVTAQVPTMVPALVGALDRRGLTMGRPILVRHCRVGVVNDIGRVLEPEIVVLLIGERPGLGGAPSLSAYLAWRPRPGCTDADRNVVSNIHDDGTPPLVAVERVMALIAAMRDQRVGGVALRVPTWAPALEPPSS